MLPAGLVLSARGRAVENIVEMALAQFLRCGWQIVLCELSDDRVFERGVLVVGLERGVLGVVGHGIPPRWPGWGTLVSSTGFKERYH